MLPITPNAGHCHVETPWTVEEIAAIADTTATNATPGATPELISIGTLGTNHTESGH